MTTLEALHVQTVRHLNQVLSAIPTKSFLVEFFLFRDMTIRTAREDRQTEESAAKRHPPGHNRKTQVGVKARICQSYLPSIRRFYALCHCADKQKSN